MNRSTWTRLGIIELGALAVLWRSVNAAPLVAFERDLVDRDLMDHDLDDRPLRKFRRDVDCAREKCRAG